MFTLLRQYITAKYCILQNVYLLLHYMIKFGSNVRQAVVFSGTPVFSTNKTDRHDITQILLKVALSTITLILLY